MYLRAINAVSVLADGNDALWGPGDYGPSPSDCRARGGTPILWQRGYMTGSYYTPNVWQCQMPAVMPAPSAPAQPANVNVTSTVQSAVSPQISPVFVQQDHPTNSPVTAGTQQTSPSPQSAASGSSADFSAYLDYIKEQDAARDAREQTLFDLLKSNTSAPVDVPAPLPAMSAGPSELDPELQAGAVAAPSKLEQYTPLIAFASAAIGLYLVMRRANHGKRG